MTTTNGWEVIEERNSATGKYRYLVVKGLISITRRPNRRNPDPERALFGSRRKAERVARTLNRADLVDARWDTCSGL